MIRNTERKKVIHCNLMGIYLAAAYNHRVAVVFHAPRSCSHIAYNAFLEGRARCLREHPELDAAKVDGSNLYVTCLSDKEAIFGGEALLRQCLLDVAGLSNYDYIIVAAGCVASVIGDDVAAICSEVERSTGVPVLRAEGAGFMSKNEIDGMLNITKALCQRFVQVDKAPKQKNTVAVFGMNYFASTRAEIAEVKRLLALVGIKKVLFPPGAMDIKQLQELAQVEAVTAIHSLPHNLAAVEAYAKSFAARNEQQFFPFKIPTTMEESYSLLKELGESLGRRGMAEEAIRKEKVSHETFLGRLRKDLQGVSYVLSVSMPARYFKIARVLQLLDDVGMVLQDIVFGAELTKAEIAAHKAELESLPAVSFLTEDDLSSLPASLLVSTIAKECDKPQYCISYSRLGRRGVESFYLKLLDTVINEKRLVYEDERRWN